MLLLLACVDPDVTALTLGDVRPVTPTVAVEGGWSTSFGKDPAADLGPLSLAADDDGVALLDQENLRILRYDRDGQPLGEVAIPSRATLDLARDGAGWALLAYDRETVSWSAQRIGADGALTAEARPPSAVDAPSGLFVDGHAVLVEQAHGRLYDVATGEAYPGRPAGDGRYVKAEKEGGDRLLLTWSDASGGSARKALITPDRPIGSVVALDARDGYTLVTLFLFEEGPAPDYTMIDPELRSVLVADERRMVDEISLPPGAGTTLARELALGPDGALWRVRTSSAGLALDHVSLEVE